MSEFSIIDVTPDYNGTFCFEGKSGLTAREVGIAVYRYLKDYEHPKPRTTPLSQMEKDYLAMLADPKFDPWLNLFKSTPTP
jgi:hypothetical protein